MSHLLNVSQAQGCQLTSGVRPTQNDRWFAMDIIVLIRSTIAEGF
jgi:hypothetical protein